MIVLKLGDKLAAVCDQCLHAYVGSFVNSLMKTYPLNSKLLCRECHERVQSQHSVIDIPEQGNDKEGGQGKKA